MPVIQRHWREVLLALLLLGQFALRGELSLTSESPVWDERLHVGYGLALLDNGPNFDGQDHPYLLAAALALPTWLHLPGPNRYAQGDVDDPNALRPARRMNLALATLALGGLWLWARRRHGAAFGLALLTVAALDPTWMAQARYATTDVGHAAGWWLAALSLDQQRRTPAWRWLLLAGGGLALALASKWSALALPLLVPLVWLLPRARLPETARAAIVPGVVAIALILLAFLLLALWRHVPVAVALDHVWSGLTASLWKRAAPRGVFLLGTWWPHGTRLYFPALLLAKTPVALLALALVGGVWRVARKTWSGDRGWLALLVGYLALAIAAKQNLGLRHLTPFLPVLWWLAAAALVALWQHRLRWAAPVLAGALAVEALAAHPHYLPFTNGLFGGIDAVPPVAVDACADWGQALPALADYLRAHPASRVDLAYFGNADPQRYVGDTVWRPCGVLGRPAGKAQARASAGDPAEVLAISTTCLYGGAGVRDAGSVDLTRRDDAWAWLRGAQPDAIVGGAIYVFRRQPGENTNGH